MKTLNIHQKINANAIVPHIVLESLHIKKDMPTVNFMLSRCSFPQMNRNEAIKMSKHLRRLASLRMNLSKVGLQ